MANTLNKKQQAILNAMDHKNLIDIISDLIMNNDQAKKDLLNKYLLSPSDVFKQIEKTYEKHRKSKRFYDYYQADEFYNTLNLTIAAPLLNLTNKIPEQVDTLASKIILEFEEFSEISDTSSGSWMDYYDAIFDVWIKSIAAQTTISSQLKAKKLFNILLKESYQGCEVLKTYNSILGNEVLRILRDLFYNSHHINNALTISKIIKDTDFFAVALNNSDLTRYEQYFDYAELLIDEVRPEKAIELLLHKGKPERNQYLHTTRWYEILITAMIEDGQSDLAGKNCIDAFSASTESKFYRLYLKSGGSEKNLSIFLDITEGQSLLTQLNFLTDIERFDLIDKCVITTPPEIFLTNMNYISLSGLRALSATMYKQGYTLSATLLRCFLAEKNITRAQSQYYTHAASDIKKAVDYSEHLSVSSAFPGMDSYLNNLYRIHKRKTSLWPIMMRKIEGISILDGVFFYHTPSAG